jgi:hypothetical protein
MKGLLAIVLGLLSLAATYYVDGACQTAGDGTSASCMSSPFSTATNPKRTITDGVARLASAGDVLNIRGIHVAHESCPGSGDGVYTLGAEGNSISVAKNGANGNPIIIQSNGYGGGNTGERAVVEGTILTGLTSWQQCADCTTGICAGVPGVCGDVWYTTRSGERLYFARKPDGTITRFRTLANLLSTYDAAAYTGASNYDGDSGETLLVRWGPAVTDPERASGIGINMGRRDIFDVTAGSTYITFRGLILRNGGRAAIEQDGGGTGLSVIDNTITRFNDSQAGSARPLAADSIASLTITGNDLSYSSSEPIHVTTLTGGVTSGAISGNYVHDIGDPAILGDRAGGTPNCTTFTNDYPIGGANTTGDFSGLTVENNVFINCWRNGVTGSGAKGILFESYCDGMIVRSNVLKNVGACFKWAPAGTSGSHTSNAQVYNNICISPGSAAGSGGDGDCFVIRTGGAGTVVAGNSVYNNACADPVFRGLEGDSSSGFTGNLFRNNIFSTGTLQAVAWPGTDASNHFDNNLVRTSASTAISWAGTSYACSAVSTLGAGNLNNCPDPQFQNATAFDYHIAFSSPAKNAGTATGMPVGRTTDIVNYIAGIHGLPSYGDLIAIQGGMWDIGACEVKATAQGGGGGGGGGGLKVIVH